MNDLPSAPSNYNYNNNPIIQSNIININQQSNLSKFELLVKQKELNPMVAEQLKNVLSTCEVVILCDDSDSMSQNIAEEGTDPFAPRNSTRWLELKKLTAAIIQFVTSINENGLDLYFLNRSKICNVNSLSGLQNIFNIPPHGDTNISESLMEIYNDKKHMISLKKLLFIIITDGEPTDGTSDPRGNLFRTINYIVENSNSNVHVSFAECTDNSEDMEYLDRWDGMIKNFDNTDDYREELMKVKMIQGNQFKFDFNDYVIKILLATFVRWYFNLDQYKVNSNMYQQCTTQSQIYQPPVNYPVPYNPLNSQQQILSSSNNNNNNNQPPSYVIDNTEQMRQLKYQQEMSYQQQISSQQQSYENNKNGCCNIL